MKKKFQNKYFCWALTIFCVMVAGLLLFFILYRFNEIITFLAKISKVFLPILYGLIFAYLMNPLLKFFEKKVFNKLALKIIKKPSNRPRFIRIISLASSAIIFILIIVFMIWIIIPQLLESFDIFAKNIPDYFVTLKNWLENYLVDKPNIQKVVMDNYDYIYEATVSFINDTIMPERTSIITNISNGFLTLIKVIMNLILGFIISLYLLFNKELFIAQTKKILYSILPIDKVNLILINIRYTDKVFNGFLGGKVLDSLIIGIICYAFMLIFRMPYPLIIAIIVGVTNIIPYFGPFIGAIPSALFILIISPSKCITFLIFIFVLQQFDGNVLGPKILGDKTGLRSFWVLFSILVFGGLFGFIGMLIGVPLFSIIYGFINGLCNKSLTKKALSVNTKDYLDLIAIDEKKHKQIYKKVS